MRSLLLCGQRPDFSQKMHSGGVFGSFLPAEKRTITKTISFGSPTAQNRKKNSAFKTGFWFRK